MKKTFVIAEIGVNHNGIYDLAIEMIDVAKKIGADSVKFQTAVPKLVATKFAKKANYQRELTKESENQLEMIKKIHLKLADYKKIKKYCDEIGIIFMSSPFDIASVNYLQYIEMSIWKIPSGEITNLPYLRKIGSFGKRVILSTGMANLGEIEAALDVLVASGTKKENITVLHATTEYPCPLDEVNLRAMQTISQAFGVDVGYSDHTLGIEIPIAAVAMGASVIEKHFTLDRGMEGPDHKASLEPKELSAMVSAIRNVEKAMGDGIKKATASETKNMQVARKSIVAAKPIKKGEIFTTENIAAKRPGSGISPMMWDEVVGSMAQRDYEEDELI